MAGEPYRCILQEFLWKWCLQLLQFFFFLFCSPFSRSKATHVFDNMWKCGGWYTKLATQTETLLKKGRGGEERGGRRNRQYSTKLTTGKLLLYTRNTRPTSAYFWGLQSFFRCLSLCILKHIFLFSLPPYIPPYISCYSTVFLFQYVTCSEPLAI